MRGTYGEREGSMRKRVALRPRQPGAGQTPAGRSERGSPSHPVRLPAQRPNALRRTAPRFPWRRPAPPAAILSLPPPPLRPRHCLRPGSRGCGGRAEPLLSLRAIGCLASAARGDWPRPGAAGGGRRRGAVIVPLCGPAALRPAAIPVRAAPPCR